MSIVTSSATPPRLLLVWRRVPARSVGARPSYVPGVRIRRGYAVGPVGAER